MISWLKGRIEDISGSAVTLDVQGVGYEVFCTQTVLSQLELGKEASFPVYTDVKEDSIRLYGFETKHEKQVFLLLLKVKGVGVRTASDIVSRSDTRELLRAIGSGEVKTLQNVKGVGKKTAERIILELKEIVADFVLEHSASQPIPQAVSLDSHWEDSLQALQVLGFMKKDAERALERVKEKDATLRDSGHIVREALRYV